MFCFLPYDVVSRETEPEGQREREIERQRGSKRRDTERGRERRHRKRGSERRDTERQREERNREAV